MQRIMTMVVLGGRSGQRGGFEYQPVRLRAVRGFHLRENEKPAEAG
jgi:hypothetical protein